MDIFVNNFYISISSNISACYLTWPSASIYIVLEPSPVIFKANPFIFRINSDTSSFTPFIVENSGSTPSILIEFAATPGNEERRILLKALPKVVP